DVPSPFPGDGCFKAFAILERSQVWTQHELESVQHQTCGGAKSLLQPLSFSLSEMWRKSFIATTTTGIVFSYRPSIIISILSVYVCWSVVGRLVAVPPPPPHHHHDYPHTSIFTSLTPPLPLSVIFIAQRITWTWTHRASSDPTLGWDLGIE